MQALTHSKRRLQGRGKDVILPLSKGAKVYTARQTKRIMRNMGIPRYAEEKSNSDAFTAASDDWTHYIKTHAVTVTKELEKWNELSKEFTANIKDAEDIEERLYSLTREQREELNEQSEDYISERNFLNDWDAFGDSAIEAFDRVRDSEYAYVADMKITEKEAADYLAELGKSMYDERIENSEAWIDKQIRYNDMSVEDTKAAYDRMAAYTQEYYDNGLISYREYIEGLNEIDEQQRKAEIYEGAVTQRGQDVYNDAVDRLEELQHQKEIKELQQEQTKVVSGLKTDYDKIEQNKKQILNGLSAQFIDVNAIASAIKADTAGTQGLLRDLLLAVKNIPGGNVYGDTNYNISGADTSILSAFMRRGVNAISGF